MRLRRCEILFLFFILFFNFNELVSEVGSVVPGQSLWSVVQRTGQTTDTVESKVDLLDTDVSQGDVVIDGKLDTVIADLACVSKSLSASDVVSGTITLSVMGEYSFSTDLTADVSITTTLVSLDLGGRSLIGVITVAAVDDVIIENGTIVPPVPTTAPSAGITIAQEANRVFIRDVMINCADSGATDIDGRDGIEVNGINSQIINCTIISGAGSSGSQDPGSSGGDGIWLASTAQSTVIWDCIIQTGNGGATSAASGTGGRGGFGIYVNNTTNAEIARCKILSTGAGGNGTAGGTGIGGQGGEGIQIDVSSTGVAVHHCIIRNTGAGGSGDGGAGAGGIAVEDDVTTSAAESAVYSNFSHNIANTINFDLQAAGIEKGVNSPNPPDSTVVNSFANVYL